MLLHIHPLQRKRRHNPRPILHRRNIQMLPVIVHGMPHFRERGRDEMQYGSATQHKRHVVVADIPASVELRRHLAALGQKGAAGPRLALEKLELPESALDGGHPLVGPVGILKVRGDGWAGGAEEVE